MEDIKRQLVPISGLDVDGMEVVEEEVVGTSTPAMYEDDSIGYVNAETGEYITHADVAGSYVQLPAQEYASASGATRVQVIPQSSNLRLKSGQVYKVSQNDRIVVSSAQQQEHGSPSLQYMQVLTPQGTSRTLGLVANGKSHGLPRPQSGSLVAVASSQYRTIMPSSGQVVTASAVRPPRKSNSLNANGRKPCNCSKSGCLKLYCDCFANGEFCQNCNCKDCRNDPAFTDERTKAIKACLERNPNAFQPKIVSSGGHRIDASDRQHLKGCHCKKSNCLKNYCECYEAKVGCTDRCRCIGCRNSEADRFEKQQRREAKLDPFARLSQQQAQQSGSNAALAASGLLSLAQAASTSDGLAGDEHSRSSAVDVEADSGDEKALADANRSLPWYCMTDEVVEATTLCLVAQAEEIETRQPNRPVDESVMEAAILREFGRCLHQILANAATS